MLNYLTLWLRFETGNAKLFMTHFDTMKTYGQEKTFNFQKMMFNNLCTDGSSREVIVFFPQIYWEVLITFQGSIYYITKIK